MGWRRLLEGRERLVGWFVHLQLMVGMRWDIFSRVAGHGRRVAGVEAEFKLIPPHFARLH